MSDNPTANCKHWGHAEGEWKWSCCACSGIPNGCDNCTEPFCKSCGVDVPRGTDLCAKCAALADPRECGWMGCGHPRCEPACAAVPLAEYLAWRASD